MQKFDMCIIGAGASGCMLAIEASKNGKSVCLIDSNEKPAKKILVTGNGKCNITNKNLSSEFYNQNIDEFLSCFSNKETEKLFASYGLDVYYDDMGRCYPVSNSAKTVQFVLNEQLDMKKVNFLSSNVVDVEKNENMYKILTSSGEEIYSKAVVFACGLNSFSTAMFQKFNINFNKLIPSLVSLKTKQNTKTLDGQRVSDVIATAKIGKKTKAEFGEVLFKDHGLSGICIFNLSSFFAKNKAFLGKISINLLPKWQISQIFENLYQKMDIFKSAYKMLLTLFSKELSTEILKRANIEKDKALLTKKEIDEIVKIITNFEFDISGSYTNNQVTSGGVCLESLTNNLESKTNKNMFFCGEICDVDGICGGYNLQWAWTSANIVANYIKKV